MENFTDYEYLLQNSYSNLAFGCAVLVFIVGFIGVTGNISIIVVYFFRIKDRGERYYIPLLALVDLLACVTSFPYIITENAYYYNYPSEVACRIFCMLRLFMPGISAFIFLLISIQRYLLVCKPLGPIMTLFWKRLSFALACGIVTIGTAPILLKSGIRTSEETYMNNNVTVRKCKFSLDPSLGTVVYFGIILLIIVCSIVATISLYIPVLKKVKISIRFFRPSVSNIDGISENTATTEKKSTTISNAEQIEMKSIATTDASNASAIQSPDPSSLQAEPLETNISFSEKLCHDHHSHYTFPREEDGVKNKSKCVKKGGRLKRESVQKRLTMMFFLLLLIYIISYIPPLVLLILTYSIKNFNHITLTRTETLIWIYVPHLVLLNHVINPFIYGYFDTQFRKQLISCFKRRTLTI